MIIERLELHYFRNYESLSLFPHPGVNIFFGPNGSGKTNLLEAIHYCSLGKSHRINQDFNAVMMGQPGASCELRIAGKMTHQDLEIRLRAGKDEMKIILIDQKRAARLSEMMGVLRCVIFSPEDLSLIKEGPAVRRKFIDMMISQVSRPYFIALQQYRIALSQRNAILKNCKIERRPLDPMIEDFEIAMANQARMIMAERIKYTALLSQVGNELYREISGRPGEDFSLRYHSSIFWEEQDPFSFLDLLHQNREDDYRQGMTTSGPHRDDLELRLNHQNMKLFASQGQMRTAALSLKLAQLKIIFQVTGDQPILLLDDVMSELDLSRRMNLLRVMEGVQTFITCSDEGDLAAWQNHRTYQVSSSDGRASIQMIKQGPQIQNDPPSMKEPDFSL